MLRTTPEAARQGKARVSRQTHRLTLRVHFAFRWLRMVFAPPFIFRRPLPSPPDPGRTTDWLPTATMLPPGLPRPIQPAPGLLRPIPPTPELPRPIQRAPRLKAVTQACQTCRRDKAKVKSPFNHPRPSAPPLTLAVYQCNGARPKCGRCVFNSFDCGYKGEAGQSRRAAMKTRLEVLEKLFSDLQTASEQDAERILQRLRSGADNATKILFTDSESARVMSDDTEVQCTRSSSSVSTGSPVVLPATSRSGATNTTNGDISICPVCGEWFLTSQQPQIHMDTHSRFSGLA